MNRTEILLIQMKRMAPRAGRLESDNVIAGRIAFGMKAIEWAKNLSNTPYDYSCSKLPCYDRPSCKP
jgi:hypothetical protein